MDYNVKVLNSICLVFVFIFCTFEGIAMEMDLKKVGQRVKAARLEKGYSQEKLAEMLDVTQALVGHLEQGRTGVALATFVKMANLLGTTADALLYDSIDVLTDEYDKDFRDLTADCTPKQRAIIYENAKALKEILLTEKV